jgi:hypothetical protein
MLAGGYTCTKAADSRQEEWQMETAVVLVFVFKTMIWLTGLGFIVYGLRQFKTSRTRSGTIEASYKEGKLSFGDAPVGVVYLIVGAIVIVFGLMLAPKTEYQGEEAGKKKHWIAQSKADDVEKKPGDKEKK